MSSMDKLFSPYDLDSRISLERFATYIGLKLEDVEEIIYQDERFTRFIKTIDGEKFIKKSLLYRNQCYILKKVQEIQRDEIERLKNRVEFWIRQAEIKDEYIDILTRYNRESSNVLQEHDLQILDKPKKIEYKELEADD